MKLQKFQGYTVDVFLREFREEHTTVNNTTVPVVVPFDSVEGIQLLREWFGSLAERDKLQVLPYIFA